MCIFGFVNGLWVCSYGSRIDSIIKETHEPGKMIKLIRKWKRSEEVGGRVENRVYDIKGKVRDPAGLPNRECITKQAPTSIN